MRITAFLSNLLVGLAACGHDVCVIPPCAPPIAVTITVTSAATGQPITNAVVSEPPTTPAGYPCGGSSGNTCTVFGGAGTHTFTVAAPGYQSVTRTVSVSGSSQPCGCEVVDTQQIAIALAVAP